MGIRNVDVIGSTDVSGGRAAIAAIVAVVGTLGLFWSMLQLELVSGNWTLVGLVTVEFPFRVWSLIWLSVRIILGLYISFVVVVIGLQLLGYWRQMTASPEAQETEDAASEEESGRGIARFSDAQVYSHGLIAISILVLWLTGLPLTFNGALGWVYDIIGGHRAITIHGFAGGLLSLTVIFYLVYGFIGMLTKETTLRYILPSLRDIREGVSHVKYLIGRGPEPDALKYTVLQKAESWIIIFESLVMLWTGLLLWSATQSTRSPGALDTLLTPWAAPFMMILRDIHAIVGITMLAGITFHLFMTHIKEWPLDTSIFTGVVEMGRACAEWTDWTAERTGRSDLECEEHARKPVLTAGLILAMGVFAFTWLGAILTYALAPLPTGGLVIFENIQPAGLPGGWLGVVFTIGLNLAFAIVILAIIGIAWGFRIRWQERGVG